MAKLDEMDRRMRQTLLNKSIKEMTELLSNREGFQRIRLISQEQWDEAVANDLQGEDNAAT